MNDNEKYFAGILFENKIFKANWQAFEDLFTQVMGLLYEDFRKVKAYGSDGDRKNDGFIPTTNTYFQCYAPEVEEYKRYMDSKLNSNIHNYVLKKDWVRRAKQFASRYFTSDKEMVYCLKDVHNYHKWVEITREINDIDWDNLNIKPKYTDIDTLGAVACSGGACEV